MVYVLRLSDEQHRRLGKARYPQELNCERLAEFLFKAHQILETLKGRGYDTSNFMWFQESKSTENGTQLIVDVSQLIWTNPYPPQEKDSGWG